MFSSVKIDFYAHLTDTIKLVEIVYINIHQFPSVKLAVNPINKNVFFYQF